MGKLNTNYFQLISTYEAELSRLEIEYFQALNNRAWTKANNINQELVFHNAYKHYLFFWDVLKLKHYGPGSRTSLPTLEEIVDLAEAQALELQVSAKSFVGSKTVDLAVENSKLIIHNRKGLVLLADFMESLVKASPNLMPTSSITSLIEQKESAEFQCPSLYKLIQMACHLRFRLSLKLAA